MDDAGNWSAHIQISKGESGWFHVHCKTLGNSQPAALEGAQLVASMLAKGRVRVFRTDPCAKSETDFNSGSEHHHGFVRFSFKDKPGEDDRLSKTYAEEVVVVGFGKPD